MMSDVSQLIAAPAVLKAVATGLLKPKGHKFKVTAKGGDRDRRFVEWPLLRIYGCALIITLAAIAYAFILHLRGENIAYGGLALAWSLYNAFILTVVCFVCIEQPRKRKAERFDRNEPILLRQGGRVASRAARRHLHHRRPADRSRSAGARQHDRRASIYGRSIAAIVVRRTPDGFAVRFEEGMDTRVHAIRAFYAGEYVRAYQGVRALPVGKALLMRLFG